MEATQFQLLWIMLLPRNGNQQNKLCMNESQWDKWSSLILKPSETENIRVKFIGVVLWDKSVIYIEEKTPKNLFLFRELSSFEEDRCLKRAFAITYWFFVCVVPLSNPKLTYCLRYSLKQFVLSHIFATGTIAEMSSTVSTF